MGAGGGGRGRRGDFPQLLSVAPAPNSCPPTMGRTYLPALCWGSTGVFRSQGCDGLMPLRLCLRAGPSYSVAINRDIPILSLLVRAAGNEGSSVDTFCDKLANIHFFPDFV